MVENRVNFKLRYMLASSDEEFQTRVREAVERRRQFESGVIDGEPSSNSEYDDQPDMMSVSPVSNDLENHSDH